MAWTIQAKPNPLTGLYVVMDEYGRMVCQASKENAALIVRAAPHIVITVSGGVAEVDEDASTGDYTYEVRDFDNCEKCGGVDCDGGHRAQEVHGELTGENQTS